MIPVTVQRLHHGARLPERQTAGAAGYDVFAAEDALVPPRGRALVPTGIAIALPPGYEGQIRPRSGLALRHGVHAHFGTIDSDYRGELKVLLHNDGEREYVVRAGERVAQLVVAPVVEAEFREGTLDETGRGRGGFGHTGR